MEFASCKLFELNSVKKFMPDKQEYPAGFSPSRFCPTFYDDPYDEQLTGLF